MRGSLCLCVCKRAYAWSFYSENTVVNHGALKGVGVSVIVKDTHFCYDLHLLDAYHFLPGAPTITSGWFLGWLAFPCPRSVCCEQAHLYEACESPF